MMVPLLRSRLLSHVFGLLLLLLLPRMLLLPLLGVLRLPLRWL